MLCELAARLAHRPLPTVLDVDPEHVGKTRAIRGALWEIRVGRRLCRRPRLGSTAWLTAKALPDASRKWRTQRTWRARAALCLHCAQRAQQTRTSKNGLLRAKRPRAASLAANAMAAYWAKTSPKHQRLTCPIIGPAPASPATGVAPVDCCARAGWASAQRDVTQKPDPTATRATQTGAGQRGGLGDKQPLHNARPLP